MEAVEDRSIINPSVYTVKPSTVEESTVVAVESSVCHKPNGVDVNESQTEGQPVNENDNNDSNSVQIEEISDEHVNDIEAAEVVDSEPIIECSDIEEGANTANSDTQNQERVAEVSEIVTEVTIIDDVGNETTEVICEEIVTESTEEVANIESSTNDKFKTEIFFQDLVEKNGNDNDINENEKVESYEQNPTNNILIELDNNIELSEVLQSDVAGDNDDNSGTIRHEVFNKEELLDILEGNDNDQSTSDEKEIPDHKRKQNLEAEIALKQLSRLARTRLKISPRIKKGDKKPVSVIKKPINTEPNSGKKSDREGVKQQNTDKVNNLPKQPDNDKVPEAEKIVSALVMDWDDDEPVDVKDNTLNDTMKEEKTAEQLSKPNEVTNIEESINQVVLDSTTTITTTIITTAAEENSQDLNKTGEEEPPRRISRVIKKKVIFDPDNPDTFTKGKTPLKNKEGIEHNSSKKPKPEQIRQRSKSKSPMSKLQWKKPSPKNSKQNKRLSEVDRLLMDEGAVNMLYQLTPDAPKGKKNMRSKAEIIKKLQSSTPETKEMKFRERKKEIIKSEDGEAKRILGGKHRISLSSSVKSPTVCDDFETHSADDSIIYRRHSSSSYSSSCMSPRRLSDVETGSVQNVLLTNQQAREISEANLKTKNISDAFMAGSEDASLGTEMINKSDCLSIKEKLNSKLSQVLNKRKRDSTKIDKPVKQKKVSRTDSGSCNESSDTKIDKPVKQKKVSRTDSGSCNESSDQFKFVSIVIEKQLAVVRVKKTSVKIGVQVIRELEEALLYLDKVKNISVTLLSSECLVLCSSLDLNIILEDNKETRVKQAYKLADSIRLLLCSAAQHSKLLCCSVWGACSSVGLALATLSDVVLASECATFALAMGSAPLFPGVAALTARCQTLPQALINDLVIFGRRISSTEALQSGLISRTLWPDRFEEQVSNIVKDIATQPAHTILLKKKLLNLKKSSEEATLLSCLEAERDLLVEYWTSVEGQELLRATLDCA